MYIAASQVQVNQRDEYRGSIDREHNDFKGIRGLHGKVGEEERPHPTKQQQNPRRHYPRYRHHHREELRHEGAFL